MIELAKRVSEKTKKDLFSASGNTCAIGKHQLYPRDPVTGEPKLDDKGNPLCIGEAAHIETTDPKRPRYDPKLTEKDSNKVENLVALCENCHKIVDSKTDIYTPEVLRKIKRDHEKWTNDTLCSAVLELGYDDLRAIGDIVAGYNPTTLKLNYDIIPIEKKIRKNRLSKTTREHLTIGFGQVQKVRDYMNDVPFLGLAKKTQARFVKLYLELKNKGLDGDSIFNDLWNLSCSYSMESNLRAGALVMISFYFQICEVFKK